MNRLGFKIATILFFLFCPAISECVAGSFKTTGLTGSVPDEVKLFTVLKISLGAANPGENPYTDGPDAEAVFIDSENDSVKVNGYWDGGNIFSIRFSPQHEGTWRFYTVSSDSGLNGVKGTFKAIRPTKEEIRHNALYHGFLQADGYSWKLSDGAKFLPVGDTQWAFTEEFFTDEWKDWINALQQRGFNTFLGCIWRALNNRAGILPFSGSPDIEVLNEAFFDRLDGWIEYANQHGIVMGLTVGGFPDNSKWFTLFNTKEMNERWFRYCVRRYSAFNVRWVLYGEVDEVNPPWSTWYENAAAMAHLIKLEDPYDHPIGSHHRYIDRATARDKDIDFLCIQSNRNAFGRMNAEYQYITTADYRQYGKPLMFEEYWYEYKEGINPGLRNTYRNFISGLAFPTMGSLMRAHVQDNVFVPQLAKNNGQTIYEYLMERDTGMQCMQYFGKFFANVNTEDFAPASEKIRNSGLTRQCGRFGNSYIIFSQNGGQVQLDLIDVSGQFKVEKMDIYSGKFSPLPDVSGGNWCDIDSGDTTDVVIRVSGNFISKYPVVNSPVKDVEFTCGEKVFLNFQNTTSLNVELLEGSEITPLMIKSNPPGFSVPENVKENGQIKIIAANKWGKICQIHRIIKHPKNNSPILTKTIAEVNSGEPVGIQLGFYDPDGPEPYVFKILKEPTHGQLSGSGNDRVYKSNPDYVGTDQFSWSVSDGLNSTGKVTVIIHVKKK
ncbi:MAG TPA: DUF4038 domain-containing protein [Draconibacterium sp.]|nr:DUF4038 domain-containing protein [Draconibacterium sp.]